MSPALQIMVKAVFAGLLACLACGLGALPLILGADRVKRAAGLAYGFAGGLMFSASVYNLIQPGLSLHGEQADLRQVLPVFIGMLLGAGFLYSANRHSQALIGGSERWKKWGGRTGLLIFVAMSIHSIPEGVAVGVGYAADVVGAAPDRQLGPYIALAIAIHNIPEGLAVAIPLRAAGASIGRCFIIACLTSLPQPLAAIPASWLSWLFAPLMPILMGFAAGAMIFLILLELIPGALHDEPPVRIAWAFTIGFCLMLLVQVVL